MMTTLKGKAANSDEGYSELASPQWSRARPFSPPESSTELVPISVMEGVEQTNNETPFNAEHHQEPRNKNSKFDRDDYTVAWICPLEVEEIAALKMLDFRHQPLSQPENDHNAYTLGSINGHNVVIASLPIAGNTHAATVVTQTRNTFPRVRFGLLVGIGGGVPTTTDKGAIRLGHVVVSRPTGTHSGAVQYDHGKVEHHNGDELVFKRTGFLAPPPAVLLGAARKLNIARAVADSDPLLDHLKRIDTTKANLKRFKCPGIANDHLYKPEYVHSNQKLSCRKAGCDPNQRVDRCSDDSDDEFEEVDPSENVVVHEGTIASGEWVMKHGLQRDEWAERDDILCFEMEAAGALADFPCLVIRGISDYADSHKNDRWQGFASAVAAAYARELFFHMPVAEVKKLGVTEADVKKIVTGTENLVQRELEANMKAWLSPPDPSANYNAASAKHLDGTGTWFIQSEAFLSWKTAPGPSALWLYGSPGCGKTILTYAVIQYLCNAVKCSRYKGAVLYYFFDFKDMENQSPDRVVRSLIFQLSRSCEDAERHLENLFQNHDKGHRQPSVQSLCATFQAMLNEAAEPMIILDALDECATRNDTSAFGGQRLPEWLGQLQCRILVTSRREADIQSCIEKWENTTILSMQDSPVDEDIRAYVHEYLRRPDKNELAEIWQSEPEVINEIETKILQKAAGMFRWVTCQLEVLAKHDMHGDLFKALESLPLTLTVTYRRILDSIPEDHRKNTARLLQFLTYGKRSLTVNEVVDALAVSPQGERTFDEKNRPRRILKHCSSLATISDYDEIHLAHFSVKEYLMSSDDKGSFTEFLIESEAETSITEVSLAYLSCLTGEDDWRLAYEPLCPADKKPYHLARYCAKHWMDHARVAVQSNEHIREKVFDFVSCSDEMPCINSLIIWNPDHCFFSSLPGQGDRIAPLYLASLLGLRYVVERLIDKGADVNEVRPETSSGHALGAACRGRDIEIIRLLLDSGADVNSSSGTWGKSALGAALCEGLEEVVQWLLDRGADPKIKERDPSHPQDFYFAASDSLKRMVELFLERGTHIHEGDWYRQALCQASKEGHVDVVRSLLQYGAVIEKSAPISASSCMHEGAVQIPLDQLSPNASTHDFCNEALQAAETSTEDGQEVIDLLLKHGADINAVGIDDKTALERCLQRDELGALSLVQKGATLYRPVDTGVLGNDWEPNTNHEFQYTYDNSPDSDAERLFRSACRRGHEDLIRLLLERYTDGQISQAAYNEELHEAAHEDCDGVVEMLLGNDSNVQVGPGKFSETLQAASDRGHFHVVRGLLENGVSPDSVDEHGWSAYSIASKYNHKSVSEALLHRSTVTTVVQSHDYSRCLPPSTFVTDQKASSIKCCSGECTVEAGSENVPGVFRADHPFIPAKGRIYFEIQVLNLGEWSMIGLGVCQDDVEYYSHGRSLIAGLWACDYETVNFYGQGSKPINDYCPGYCVNDTIGCCVDYDADQLFFTINGEYLGRASKAPIGRLFAFISVGDGARVSFDFTASCPVAIP